MKSAKSVGSSKNNRVNAMAAANAGFVNEFIFADFERFRAWINMPAIFGASNATRDHAQIAKKLDEYNAYAKLNGNKEVPLFNVAHSLGVSGNKNMLNWSKYMNQSYNNTKVTYWHLGGSYSDFTSRRCRYFCSNCEH
ncbi:hypothetical protein [Actinobacillus porcinus]|uniref:hypothetical protein n=1 Tax=Actinobacillus porcinus TaxID=51048 RepID=UPI003899AD9B